MSAPIPLLELEAEIRSVNYGDEAGTFLTLLFACPICPNGHWNGVPFHDGPSAKIGASSTPVWHRESGSTIADLTLSPSYHVVKGCGLHGFIRSGTWVSC